MNSRALGIGILGLLLCAGLWVVLDPAGFGLSDASKGGPTKEQGQELARNDELQTKDGVDPNAAQREAIVTEDASQSDTNSLLARPVEMGIPSFVGRVLLANGKPAAKASVSAYGFRRRVLGLRLEDARQRPVAQRAVLTNSGGDFRLPESPMEDLRWVLRFEYEGYPSFDLVDLASIPGRTRSLGELSFAPGVTVRGVVTASNGAPVLAAQVRAMRASEGPRLSRWLEGDLYPIDVAPVRTNRNGEFELADLPAGSLRIVAEFSGYETAISTEVEAQTGAIVENVHVVLREAQPLRGIVQTSDGAPVQGAQLFAAWKPSGNLLGECDLEGRFSLDLPADASEITLRVTSPGFAVFQQRVSAKQRDQELKIQLATAPNLAGRIIDENGEAIVGARVALFEQSQQRIASVAPWQQQPLSATESDADGKFALRFDPSSSFDRRYRVLAWTEQHTPARSRTLSFEQRKGLAPARLAEEIVLTLKEGLVVTGTVSTANGKFAAGARVMLRRDGSTPGNSTSLSGAIAAAHGEIIARATANSSGAFKFEGLAAGDYHLEAHLPGYSPARGESFGLVDQHWSEDLKLSYPTGIRGIVQGDRSALSRLQVVAITEGRAHPCLVRSDGSFHIPDIAPGLYQVEVFADSGTLGEAWGRRIGPRLAEMQEVQLLEGETTELLFELDVESFAKLAGTVALNGLPGADYRVFLLPAGYEGSSNDRERQFVTENMRSTITDQAGKFSFSGLGELEYWLVLVPPAGSRVGGMGGVFHSDGPMGLARARVSPSAGETYRHDFALQLGVFAGHVVGERKDKEVPVRKGVATLTPPAEMNGVRRVSVSIGRDGRFQFPPLPIGKWTLELRADGFRRMRSEVALSSSAQVGREFRLRSSGSTR